MPSVRTLLTMVSKQIFQLGKTVGLFRQGGTAPNLSLVAVTLGSPFSWLSRTAPSTFILRLIRASETDFACAPSVSKCIHMIHEVKVVNPSFLSLTFSLPTPRKDLKRSWSASCMQRSATCLRLLLKRGKHLVSLNLEAPLRTLGSYRSTDPPASSKMMKTSSQLIHCCS